ncbi:MAG: nitrous oxide reductase accessory protein NosL [Planctomycetes bacterium]|nr:nitrous oxide reductase accessory protein NosL [Planctomycetota bacterium]
MSRFVLLVLGLVVVGACVVVGRVLLVSTALPEGPVPAVWDHEACAYCRMHIGEPPFAAQLQTKDGQVLFFDDPGCLFEMLDRDGPQVHAMYFHHMREDRWIGTDDVAFLETKPTPMGYGIAAVTRGVAGAVSFDAAREIVRSKREDRQK